MHRKTFSRSEQAAILGLAELYKAGFVSTMMDFEIMLVGDVEKLHAGDNRWLNRVITFSRRDGNPISGDCVSVTVRTLSGSEYPPKEKVELQVWEPWSASMSADYAPDFLRKKNPVPHWYSCYGMMQR